jgi:uncharacterized protein (DUF362 family)
VSGARVAIADDSSLAPAERLAAALERAGFWPVLAGRQSSRIVVLPQLGGFSAGSPLATTPSLVETLVDLLHDRGHADVAVAGSMDSSALWAANREVYPLADLLGYRFVTPNGRAYDLVDLTDDMQEDAFPLDSALHGSGLSRAWRDADIRIVFGKNRTDEEAGYALCLDTLLSALPLPDKTLHYRRRRDVGDVVSALLDAAPVHFALIDAVTSAHGAGGGRSAVPIETRTVIAASDIVLADYIGALKMGLDPAVSPIMARVLKTHRLPQRYDVSGGLAPYPGWCNVPVTLQRATQARTAAPTLDRLMQPWLQSLDPELFPLAHPLDARINATLAPFFADSDASESGRWMLIAANVLVALIGHIGNAWRTLFNKDALHRMAVPLGFDPATVGEQKFDELVDELRGLEPIAADAPEMAEGLRWRMVEDAVVFRYQHDFPIDYEQFIGRVDVARTIQFMNDYLGGVVMPLAFDKSGRPVRQAERNIYLPQPNYLVLYQGKPIDVSKLEVVAYETDQHRLYWKTIASENGSASADDGIATFERLPEGTRVSIVGRQAFTLPLFWQVFDLNLLPDLKATLVTHAYRTFFDRTMANFEALVEGRDTAIGRPVDEPATPPVEQLASLLATLGEAIAPLLQRAAQNESAQQEVDADGFVHLRTGAVAETEPVGWLDELTRFISGLQQAVQRDMTE